MIYGGRLHHAAHATHAAGGHCGCGVIFLLVGNHALGGEEHACNRGSVLQSHAGNLGRVDYTLGKEVAVTVGAGVVAEVGIAFAPDFVIASP